MKSLLSGALGLVALTTCMEAQSAQDALPSATLRPVLAELGDAASGVRLDKWKGSAAAKDETAANLQSIRKDMDGALPGLIATADASPASVVAVFPVLRNVGALYDVLLRVEERAKGFAPADEVAMLEKTRVDLEDARRGLEDRVQALAVQQDGTMKAMIAAANAKPVAPVAPPTTVPAKKKKAKVVAASPSN